MSDFILINNNAFDIIKGFNFIYLKAGFITAFFIVS